VVSAKNRNFIVCGLTILGNNTVRALEAINQELAQLRLYSQQTRYAVDYQLAQQGGVCTIVGNTCITQVTDESLNITAVITDIERQLDHFKQGAREEGDWFEWLLGKTWGSYIMHGIIMMVSVFLVLCLGLKCINTSCNMMLAKAVPGASVSLEPPAHFRALKTPRRPADGGLYM